MFTCTNVDIEENRTGQVPMLPPTTPTRCRGYIIDDIGEYIHKSGTMENQNEVTINHNLDEISMLEIRNRSRMSESTPEMTPPLISNINYNVMTTYGNQILLVIAPNLLEVDPYINN